MTETTVGTAKKRKLVASDSSSASAVEKAMEQKILDDGTQKAPPVERISYIEFYSGVGGWTMALQEALERMEPLLSSIRTKNPIKASSSKDTPIVSHDEPTKTCANRRYELQRLAALDHSDLCVRVFSHNFARTHETNSLAADKSNKGDKTRNNRRPGGQKSFSIERMPLRQLEEWSADVWVMSPPCQPHTRQHINSTNREQTPVQEASQNRKDLEDPRSKSFLRICEWLEGAPSKCNDSTHSIEKKEICRLSDKSLPSLIFLENVVGFELSNSFEKWESALRSRGYMMGHFHLTPTQVLLPNDRPRFYTVAIRISSVSTIPKALADVSLPTAESLLSYFSSGTEEKSVPAKIWKSILELDVTPEDVGNMNAKRSLQIAPIHSFLDQNHDHLDANKTKTNDGKLRVPEKVLKNKSAWCFDIVGPNDRRSSCFTHSYGRFIRGTGSILYADDENDSDKSDCNIQLLPPDQREFQADWMDHLDPKKLRYFSGMELARMFGFSKDFSFPPDTSLKQQWKLMGNSLNVRVASKLVELGFLLRYYYYVDKFDDR